MSGIGQGHGLVGQPLPEISTQCHDGVDRRRVAGVQA